MTDQTDQTWERYLLDVDGFVLEPAETLLVLYAREGPDPIKARYGDMVPDRIIVARGTAAPKPQYAGSTTLRHPGSWMSADQITFDVYGIQDADSALILWHAAEGAARHLNSLVDAPQDR